MIKNTSNKLIKLQISDLDVYELQFCYSDRIEVSEMNYVVAEWYI